MVLGIDNLVTSARCHHIVIWHKEFFESGPSAIRVTWALGHWGPLFNVGGTWPVRSRCLPITKSRCPLCPGQGARYAPLYPVQVPAYAGSRGPGPFGPISWALGFWSWAIRAHKLGPGPTWDHTQAVRGPLGGLRPRLWRPKAD